MSSREKGKRKGKAQRNSLVLSFWSTSTCSMKRLVGCRRFFSWGRVDHYSHPPQTPSISLSCSGCSCSLTKPGKIWAGSALVSVKTQRETLLRKLSPPKETVSWSQEFPPPPGGVYLEALETFWLPAPHLFLAVRKQGRVRTGEKGAGAGKPPAAGQRNWPAGPGDLAQSKAWGGF